MAADTLEAKAHELLGQLNPGKRAAVVHLLEVMVHDEDDEEELTEEERLAIAASREYFRQGGQGLSFEQVVAECGFTMDQIRGAQKIFVNAIRFDPNVPADIRAIDQKAAMTVLKAIHRYAETGAGLQAAQRRV